MKIERFVLGGFIAAVFFTLILTLLGDSVLQSSYGVTTPPTFSNTTNYYDDFTTTQSSFESELMTASDPGQSNEVAPEEDRFWIYQGRALKAVWDSVSSPNEAKGSITELGQYLKVNSIIIGTIISFLVLSFGFAVAAWWKNRRP